MRRLFAATGVMLALAFAAPAHADDPMVDRLLATSPGELRAAIQQLPPEVQAQIRQQLQTRSLDELAAMSPDQIRAMVQSLSPETKAALKAKWASLSPEEKAQLKSLNLKALWQQLVARFQAMGPAERAIVKKLLGEAAGDQ